MFDTYYTQPRDTQYVTKEVNVKEYKAPTDESVKLLNEMTEKSLANIVKQFSVQDNEFNFGVMVYKNPLRYTTEVVIKFKLNGKEHTANFDVDEFKSVEGQVQDVYKAVSGKLAEILIAPVFDQIQRNYK
ncbi:hypothetical protein [Pseudomonas phage vB_PsaM_M1]|nr:hypothetical protein [Pseudomonas phage vB_PsaM_M1]